MAIAYHQCVKCGATWLCGIGDVTLHDRPAAPDLCGLCKPQLDLIRNGRPLQVGREHDDAHDISLWPDAAAAFRRGDPK